MSKSFSKNDKISNIELTLNLEDGSADTITDVGNMIVQILREDVKDPRWFVDVSLEFDMTPTKLDRLDKTKFAMTVYSLVNCYTFMIGKPNPIACILTSMSNKKHIRLCLSNDEKLIKKYEKIARGVRINPASK